MTYVNAAGPGEEFPPLGQLPAACRAAKAQFRPLTTADLDELKVELLNALARLDRRLETAGKNGARWRKYLRWGRLRAQLRTGRVPELAVLDAVYKRYTAGHEGLELVWFRDVRQALRRYRDMAGRLANPALQTSYERLLDFLAEHLQAHLDAPTPEEAWLIGQAVHQLEEARQAPALVRAIRHHYRHPNLLMMVSADVIAAGIASSVDETGPVREVILGTDIYGTGHTTGKVSVELSPDQTRSVIEAVFRGTVQTRNVGYNGPVIIYSNGSSRVNARKRLWIDANGLDSLPTVSNAVTETEITGIRARRGGRCVERIAWRRACKQKSQSEYIASRRTEKRINNQINQQVAQTIGQANQAFAEKFREPLLRRNLFPRQLRFTTTRSALHVVSLYADQSQLAPPAAPPPLPEPCDLALSLHQSMINNMATSALAGTTLDNQTLETLIVNILGELPEQFKGDEDQQSWAVDFSRRRQPVSVSFAHNGLRVTIRGRRFYKGEESYPGMDVTADYKIVRTEQGFKAVRQGDLQIFPPGFVPGRRKLSPREVVIRTLLQRRFGKIFEKEMMGEGFVLPGKWNKAGEMRPIQLTSEDGWLTVAWRRVPADQTLARTRHPH